MLANTPTHIYRRVDHRMSLLVVAITFLPRSRFSFSSIRTFKKKKEEEEERRKKTEEENGRKKSFTQSVMPEDAANFADWLVRACMMP